MAKFKKITTKYMCMLSAVVMFVSALFYPFETFRAELSGSHAPSDYTVTFDINYDEQNIMWEDSVFTVFPDEVDSDTLSEHTDYHLFYHRAGVYYLFDTDSNYYAYRIQVKYNNINNMSATRYITRGGYFATTSDYYSLQGIITGDISLGSVSTYWYVTNFSDDEQMTYSHLYTLYEEIWSDSLYESWNVSYPSVSFSGKVSITYLPYTIENLNDEIYLTLRNIYSNNQQMLSKLEQIYTSVDTVETKLQGLVNIAQQIEDNTDELEGLLQTCNSYLASIKTELEEQTSWLERIWNTLVDYFDTSSSQQDKVDDFANNSSQQSGSLDNLVNDMGQLEKPSIDSATSDIDKVIPNGNGFVFDFLRTVTEFDIVDDMLLLTVTMAFVAYVLFGKR